jgi:CO/xanthine dehydrogenase Mo-binding subunit
MVEHHIIGQRIPRVDAESKARGQAIFGADVQLAHTLTAKFLGSPHPRDSTGSARRDYGSGYSRECQI